MLLNTTIAALKTVTGQCTLHMDVLSREFPGAIFNELKRDYKSGEDLKNQHNVIIHVNRLAGNIIPALNDALNIGNVDKFKFELNNFYGVIEEIFQSSLTFQEEGKGRQKQRAQISQVYQDIIVQCRRAREIIHQDGNVKQQLGNSSKLAESMNELIKGLGHLLGLKIKDSKKERIMNLVRVVPYVHEHASQDIPLDSKFAMLQRRIK